MKVLDSHPRTCDHGERGDAGEGRDVHVHALKVGGELHDGVDPLAETSYTLQPVHHHAVTEDQLPFHRIGPETGGKSSP